MLVKDELLPLLINPYTGDELKREGDLLVDVTTGEKFAINSSVPVLLRKEEITGLNRLYQKRYEQIEEQPKIISIFYQKPDPEVYEPPLKYIPGNMQNVVNHMLWDDKMYLVSFQKPE